MIRASMAARLDGTPNDSPTFRNEFTFPDEPTSDESTSDEPTSSTRAISASTIKREEKEKRQAHR